MLQCSLCPIPFGRLFANARRGSAVLGAAVYFLLSVPPACAQTTIMVNNTAQGPTVNNPSGLGDLACTLGDAILTANSLASSGGPVGGCGPSNTTAPYTIVLPNATFTLTSVHNYWYGPNALPPIATQIVIQGNGATLNIPASDKNEA